MAESNILANCAQELLEAGREERRLKKEAEQKKKEEQDARLAQQQNQEGTDGYVLLRNLCASSLPERCRGLGVLTMHTGFLD